MPRLSRLLMLVGLLAALAASPVFLRQPSADAQAATGFAPTGPLVTPRADHTATLLQDGRVLIVGGVNGGVPVGAAEIYDPATGQFTEAGQMLYPRFQHGAALLPDGDVLIAGGRDAASTGLFYMERYSIATGSFSAVGPLMPALLYPSVTALSAADGRVLVAGGYILDGGVADGTGRLFDPTTNAVATAENSLTEGRFRHAAVLLDDGTVLLAGGKLSNAYRGSAEIFDPATNRFSVAADTLDQPRSDIAALRLTDGRVLLAGGETTGGGESAVVEIFEPSPGRFVAGASLPTIRSQAASALLADGRVLIAGGYSEGSRTNSAVVYTPGTGAFAPTAALQTARSGHSATRLADGTVLVVGGSNGVSLASAERYTPERIDTVGLQPAAPAAVSSTNPNVSVQVTATGAPGSTDTVTVQVEDAAGTRQVQSIALTIQADGTAASTVTFSVASLGPANVSATDTSETSIAPVTVAIQPAGFALAAPAAALRSDVDYPVDITALAAGTGAAEFYRGTPRLTSPEGPTHDAAFSGACPAFAGATQTCYLRFGDLGARAVAASDGGATTFAPLTVVPYGFVFSAVDADGGPIDFATYRSGTQVTLTVTAIARSGASIVGYDGGGYTVRLTSNDRLALDRSTTPAAGSATFDRVAFVKLGGQAGSPFTPRLRASDGLRDDAEGYQGLTVGPATLSVAAPPGPVRSGAAFDLTISVDALGGAPEDREDYAGTVALAAPADPAANLPATLTFEAAHRGSRTLPVTLRSLGEQAITATEGTSGATGWAARRVAPLALAIAGESPQPVGATAPFTVVPVADGAGATDGYDHNVTLSATGGATVATPNPRSCPGSCTFSVSFPQSGQVTLAAADDGALGATAPDVVVAVEPPSTLAVSPAGLRFTATLGGPAPPSQALTITHTGAFPLNWNAAATTDSGGAWLQLDATSGATPATVQVSVASGSLALGTYTGTITVSAPNAANGAETMPVALTVSPQRYTLTYGVSPGGAGTISGPPSGTSFDAETPVTLLAQPASGYRLDGWTVNGEPAGGTSSLTVVMNQHRVVTANFVPAPPTTFVLNLSATAGGVAAASPGGPYAPGTAVTLTATAAADYRFAGWLVDGVASGDANPLTVVMGADRTVVATFAPRPQDPPAAADCGAWSCWRSHGGVLTDAPAAAAFNGRVYAFARGSDDGLYVRSSSDGQVYSAWTPLGGQLTAAPAATAARGRLFVFARGSDDALYVKSSADGRAFGEWQRLGGRLTAPPAATSVNGVLYVFARGSDRGLYVTRSTDGRRFGAWQALGGVLTAAPAAAGFQGRVYAFARGADLALYETSSGDGVTFTPWRSRGGILTAAPAAAAAAAPDGTPALYLLARGDDGHLYERHASIGVYTEWRRLGGPIDGAPAAAGLGRRLFVFARGQDDALWERHSPR